MTDSQKPTILVVDDEAFILSVISRMLEREGYNVVVAGSGEHALTLLGTFSISLVLTDIRMPGMDGVQLAATILKRCPELPLLFVSGCCDLIPHEMNYGHIPKPFNTNDLVNRVADCLNRPENQVHRATGS